MEIDLLYPDITAYGVLQYFTKEFAAALAAEGVTTRIIDLNSREDVQSHINNPPTFSFAFNGVLPDKNGKFLTDFTGVPHVSWIVDSPMRFVGLVGQPKSLIFLVDEFFQKEALQFNPQSFFLPHGWDDTQKKSPKTHKKYPILFPCSWGEPQDDEEEMQMKWRHEALDALQGLPVTLLGNNSENKGFKTLGQVDWNKTRQLFQDASLVLQVAPKVKSGGHERIFESLAAGAIPISTPNTYLKQKFPHLPQYASPSELREIVEFLLKDDGKRQNMVDMSTPELASHTWRERAKTFLKILNEHYLKNI